VTFKIRLEITQLGSRSLKLVPFESSGVMDSYSPSIVTMALSCVICGVWWESVKPLQYYTATLPISYFIDQRKLLFWKKLAIHNNNFLVSLSRLLQNRFYAIGSLYDITTMSASVGQIKSAVWSKFTETV